MEEFKKSLPIWKSLGVEPPPSKISTGWEISDHPQPEYMNYLHNQTYEALKELQENAAHKNTILKKEELYVNIKDFGAKGDATTDDTKSFLAAIKYMRSVNNGTLFVPEGVYIIKEQLFIDFSNLTIKGSCKTKTILRFKDSYSLTCIYVKGSSLTPVTHVSITDIQIDFSDQLHKGGLKDTPFDTHPNPFYDPAEGIREEYVAYCEVSNCILNNIYGDGIKFLASAHCSVKGNLLFDCGGSNIIKDNLGQWDNFGDGIIVYRSYAFSICNNIVINKRKFKVHYTHTLSRDTYNLFAARSGIEYEYPLNVDNIPPIHLADDVLNKDGFALNIKNNYVFGYTKGVHLESTIKVHVNNNTIIGCHIGIMYTGGVVDFIITPTSKGDDTCIFAFNYFDDNGVGPAPQLGYNYYHSGIAISQYGTSTAVQIIGNWFYGKAIGITLGRSGAIISNNQFKNDDWGIFNIIDNLENFNITNNSFEQSNAIRIWHCKLLKITNNQYIETKLSLNNSSFSFSNNVLLESYIISEGECKRFKITYNDFKFNKNSKLNALVLRYLASDFCIKNNQFYLSSTNKAMIEIANDANDVIITENRFYAIEHETSPKITPLIKINSSIRDFVLKDNKVKTPLFIKLCQIGYLYNDIVIERNKMSTSTDIVIESISGNSEGGYVDIKNNKGLVF